MATERVERELRRRLREVLGDVAAMALIRKFPPRDWTELPSSADLTAFEARIDARFTQVDGRLAQIDDRLTQVDDRFVQIDDRFAQIDDRLAGMDVRFERLDGRFEALEHRLTAAFRGELNTAITAQTRTIIFGLLGAMAGMGGLSLAMVRLVA